VRDAYLYAKGLNVGLPPFINPLTGTEPPTRPPAVAPAVSNHPYCFPGEKCQFIARRPALSQPNPVPFRGGS